MNPVIEYFTGMNVLTDQVLAMDCLITAKSGVRNYAMAVTESGTPEIKRILTRQLEEALDLHEEISSYMADKGWYQPWEPTKQIKRDLQTMHTALQLPTMG